MEKILNMGDSYNLNQIQKNPMFKSAVQNTLPEINTDLNYERDQQPIERNPGSYLDINCVIGYNTKPAFP